MYERLWNWNDWKSAIAARGGVHQHDERQPDRIDIWFHDEPEIHRCVIWKGAVQGSAVEYEDLTQEQNDAAKADWLVNWKPTSNRTISPKASDGRAAVCVTTAKRTRNFKLRPIWFYTSRAGSARSASPITHAEHGDVSITLRKKVDDAWIAASDADATQTILDWDPLYAFEIIGGWVDVPPGVESGITNSWFLSCVGIPDYAQVAVDFVGKVNLEAVRQATIVSNGRATQYLSPTVVEGTNYHTNRIRWVVDHPAGLAERFQVFIETFTD